MKETEEFSLIRLAEIFGFKELKDLQQLVNFKGLNKRKGKNGFPARNFFKKKELEKHKIDWNYDENIKNFRVLNWKNCRRL